MQAAILIPARLASTRLPGKLLLSESGKPLIQHTYENVLRCRLARFVAIVTGDAAIAQAVTRFGARVIWSCEEHAHGTSRIAEAAAYLPNGIGLVVNVQGDEPLLHATYVDQLIAAMGTNAGYQVGTLTAPLEETDRHNPHVVKVAVSGTRALYFSRAPLAGASRHVGVYAYWRSVLPQLRGVTPSSLMQAEQLEQLYFLERGWNILAIPAAHSLAIDTRSDYDRFLATC